MNWLVPILLFGWPVVALALFRILPPRRAVLVGIVLGWLFLPVAAYSFPHMPVYHKIAATVLGPVFGILIFDRKRLLRLRPSRTDLGVVVYCASTFAASVFNGLGVRDGISASLDRAIVWGAPYLLGRLYFGDFKGLNDLARGILFGGLAYVPLCLLEVASGPQLHQFVYGYHQGNVTEAIRFGGWRPIVFMQEGLMVADWMAVASVIALWLWWAGVFPSWKRRSFTWVVPVLALTTILLKSVNGWCLFLVGTGILLLTVRLRRSWPMVMFIAVMGCYVVLRAGGFWSAEQLATATQQVFGAERANSVRFRLRIEDMIVQKVHEQPFFGFGRHGPGFYATRDLSPAAFDSQWSISFGESGGVGLAGLVAMLLLPVALFARRFPARTWTDPTVAPAAALSVVLALYMLDDLLNAMVNPIFMLIAGGVLELSVFGHPVRAADGRSQ